MRVGSIGLVMLVGAVGGAALWEGQAGRAWAAPTPAPGVRSIDARADALLKRASETLGRQRRFNVVIDERWEYPTEAGRSVQLGATSEIQVERPNRLRMDRHGDLADVSMFYDRGTLTLYRPRTGFFSTAAAPSSLDRTLDFARERIEIEIPAADLLGADFYRTLAATTESGELVGRETIRGVTCEHIVLRNLGMERNLWIEAGGQTVLPCRYAIAAKVPGGVLRSSAEFRNWSFAPVAGVDPFSFQAPQGARRIPLLEMMETFPRPQARE